MTSRAIVRLSHLTLFIAAFLCCADRTLADTYQRVTGVDVIEYVFRLTLSDDTDSIGGMATLDVRITDPDVASLPLDFVGSSTDGATGMTVHAVWALAEVGAAALGPRPATSERGQPLAFDHQGDQLEIALPAHLTGDRRLQITVAYSGTPATGLKIADTKHGDRSFFSDNWPNKARHWLPTIDHPYDKARSQMVVIAPAHYQVVSNGLLIEQTDLPGGARLTHWKQSVPIATWLNVLGVARFAVQHLAEFEGKPVQTWVYAQDRDAGFFDFAVPTKDVLGYFSEKVGPFAYEKLANIQSNSVGGGMESASAIFYDDDSVTGERTVRWRNVIIHELAHQWFGNAVTEADWDDVWLSEGFATYFTLLFREHAYGRDDFVEGLRQARDRVFEYYEDHPDYRVVHDQLDDMSKVLTGMQYQKGAWTLHMLRDQVGTEYFWAAIRDYYAEYQNGNARTSDFRRVVERVSGQDLGWFFYQWLYRGGVPRLDGTWRYDGSAVHLDLRQVQPSKAFRLPVTILLRFDDGSQRQESILMTNSSQSFAFSVDRRPAAVVLDPATWMLLRSTIAEENN